jgi:uncharacterized membrane protein
MKVKILNGILFVNITSVLLVLSILFIPSSWVRVVLGIPFLLFCPGYILSAVLFVKSPKMNNIEAIMLSCGMSIAIVALIGFGLNYTTWGIRLEPVLYSTITFVFIMSIAAWVLRIRILKTKTITRELKINFPGWEGSTFNKILSIILAIIILTTLGVLAYTLIGPQTGERFTEFYILGVNGKAIDYPIGYSLDGTSPSPPNFTVGIINHEQRETTYFIKIMLDEEMIDFKINDTITNQLGPIILSQGEKRESQISFIPRHTGDNQKVELFLFKNDQNSSEYSVHFWIDVK